MGIDIYLRWPEMSEEDEKNQYTGTTLNGNLGYLRESYHGGPYATKILLREAFESDNGRAEIPAAVMRERLTHVTEPVIGATGGHLAAAMLVELMRGTGAAVEREVLSDITRPMTVEEAVRERCARLYPDAEAEYADAVVRSFQDFVALAEQKERETGRPCTVIASY